MIEKTRRKYAKPAMQVYDLPQTPRILAGSGLNDPNDYPDGGDPFQF